jgi:hypothetical protein
VVPLARLCAEDLETVRAARVVAAAAREALM